MRDSVLKFLTLTVDPSALKLSQNFLFSVLALAGAKLCLVY